MNCSIDAHTADLLCISMCLRCLKRFCEGHEHEDFIARASSVVSGMLCAAVYVHMYMGCVCGGLICSYFGLMLEGISSIYMDVYIYICSVFIVGLAWV